MSIAELTNKIEGLSDDDYKMIVMLIERLSVKDMPLKKMSEDDLVKELSESIENSNNGNTKPAKQVSLNMRNKYAV